MSVKWTECPVYGHDENTDDWHGFCRSPVLIRSVLCRPALKQNRTCRDGVMMSGRHHHRQRLKKRETSDPINTNVMPDTNYYISPTSAFFILITFSCQTQRQSYFLF